jgi:predicted GTPase
MTISVDFVETDHAVLVDKVRELLGKKVLSVETRSMVVTPPGMKLEVKYSDR